MARIPFRHTKTGHEVDVDEGPDVESAYEEGYVPIQIADDLNVSPQRERAARRDEGRPELRDGEGEQQFTHLKTGHQVRVPRGSEGDAEAEGYVPDVVYQAEKKPVAEADKVQPAEAGLRGIANAGGGFLPGVSDDISGVVETVKGLPDNKRVKKSLKDMDFGAALDQLSSEFKSNRRAYQRRDDQAWDEQGLAYGSGYAAGSAPAMLTPFAGLRAGAGMGQAAAHGLAYGMLQGAGGGTDLGAELFDPLKTGVGAGIGAVTGPFAQWAGKKVAGPVAEGAERMGSRRIGMAAGGNESLQSMNEIRNRPGGLEEYGREMHEMGIVSPLAGPETMRNRAGAIREEEGGKIGDVLDTLDMLNDQSGTSSLTTKNLHGRAKEGVIDPLAEREGGPTAQSYLEQNILKPLENKMKPTAAERMGPDDMGPELPEDFLIDRPMSFGEANKRKGNVRGLVNFGRERGEHLVNDKLLQIGQLYNDAILGAAAELASKQAPDLVPQLRAASKRFGPAAQAEDALDSQLSRNYKNNPFGLFGMLMGGSGITGGAAAAAGGADIGRSAAIGAGSAVLSAGSLAFMRRYGNQISGIALRNLSEALGVSEPALQRLIEGATVKTSNTVIDKTREK